MSAHERAIAVIGMAARFPQSETLDELWDNLSHNRVCTELVPDERWDAAADGGPRPYGGFLRGIEHFDARLFNISPREAREMDPQQRLFLEAVWSTLEDAGYGQLRQRPQSRVGLFVGSMWHDYSLLSHERGFLRGDYAGAGAPTWAVANRISFALKFAGPSLAVNTACSSSLLAIHLACQSLRNGECELAIAGGVNLHLHPGKFRYLREETLLADSGEKACFTPGAEGYVPGEGVGAVLLKPLARALADGDHIDAVIRASGTNHNGGGMFFKVPNAAAQAELIRATWREADIDPATISYMEMSAYGSEMVDAAELSGLTRAFTQQTSARGHCALGTLKPNLGHLEAACGVAQLIKMVLQLRHRKLLPARFAPPSSTLKLEHTAFVLQRDLAPWNLADSDAVRRAGISSFGAGGTNVHLIVEEAPTAAIVPSSNAPALIVLSAGDSQTLSANVAALRAFLESDGRMAVLRLEDVAWTLQTGREEMRERLAFVSSSMQEVHERFVQLSSGVNDAPGIYRGRARPGAPRTLQGTLEELAAHWVQGGQVGWPRATGVAPRRISLPTYSFKRESYWLGRDLPAGESDAEAVNPSTTPREVFRDYLRAVIGAELGLAVAKMATDLTFEELGFDSLLIKRLNVTLARDLGSISKTLFFRYRTIDELADHLSAALPGAVETLRSNSARSTDAAAATRKGSTCQQPRRLYEPATQGAAEATDIAIIGLAGRYPGADSLDAFWDVLSEGRDCITEVPSDRWPGRHWFEPMGESVSKSYSKWGGFLDGVDRFDPLFFDISPREAALMDPQERLFLETAWHAIEDAGYTPAQLAKQRGRAETNVGVFVGVMWSEYQFFGVEEAQRGRWTSPSSAFWSVPNRVSFCFDFDGPSLALDTACSSSLVAIHLACESLRRGECATALAGGVSLSLHPMKYIGLSQKRFASTDGRCRSFGEGGDGYVPGEGVGAVLLKPLSAALAGGDSIYGVIKGTHVNHGGRTNGYTVPSPRAQGALIAAALRKARIDARTIGYVEAHGTGTSLGDPIEVDGLTEAFGGFSQDRQFCALGSVKSNIGHLESAAGVAGLTKVLLQLRHRWIAPSLHSTQLNPNIDFAATPFHVPQAMLAWQAPTSASGDSMPRRAGVSSFGAGGVNAHVIVEEWSPAEQPRMPMAPNQPRWFVFSARDGERLRELVGHFTEFASRPDFDEDNAAYTLQLGRVHLEERLAVSAASGAELAMKLRGWLNGDAANGLMSGTARRLQHDAAHASSDEGELVRAWIAGADVSWMRMHEGASRKRIHLPTYRFARERHWVTVSSTEAMVPAALHPMIDANCSSFEGVSFRKTFAGAESSVRDHMVNGKCVVPGVAWIEMMLAAAEIASQRAPVGIEDIAWLRPVVCEGEPREVSLRITRENESRARCELFAAKEGRDELIARGMAIWSERALIEAPRPDIGQLRARCGKHRDEESCYQALKDIGLEYGPALRGVRELFVDGPDSLARLAIARSDHVDARIKLPVALLDGAFQAAALTAIGELPENARTLLPSRVGELRVYGPAPRDAWAVIERRMHESDADEGMFVYDLVLTDEAGAPWADVRGFALKAARPATAASSPRMHLFRPEWITTSRSDVGAHCPSTSARVLILSRGTLASVSSGWDAFHVVAGTSFSMADDRAVLDPRDPDHFVRLWQSLLARGWHPDAVVHLWSFSHSETSVGGAPHDGITALFHLLSAGLRASWPKRDVQWLHVYPSDDSLAAASSAAIAGFVRSVMCEQPRCRGRVVAVTSEISHAPAALWSVVAAELTRPVDGDGDVEIRIDEQHRRARRLSSWQPELRNLAPGALRADGAWIVTGGAGGLGLIFARELLRLGIRAIVLVGRKAADAALEHRLSELRGSTVEVEYVPADITDQIQVEALMTTARQRYGCIRGVIHSAAVLRDAYLLKKTPDAFAAVLAPKVWGTFHLDAATRRDDLDAFVLFSSTAAVTGNAGQTDYAAGNRFMDEFASWRNQQAAHGHRRGVAISIGWPLWLEGGMQVNEVAAQALRERLGMTPLSTQHGLAAFRVALVNRVEQLVVVEGEPAAVQAAFAPRIAERTFASAPAVSAGDALLDIKKLMSATEQYLRSLVAQVSGVAPERLEADAPLERYGLDSVMVMSLNRHLEKDLPGLSKTLLYEYQTLTALTGHLLETRPEQLQAKLAPAAAPVAAVPKVISKAMSSVASRVAPVDGGRERESQSDAGDIAIIGVSGQYPQAQDWRELWDVLAAGRDCITEIPPDRWDYRRYFDPAKGKPGRTYGKWGGFIAGHDEFDPLFFNISPREAEMMDPQERLFLRTAWHAIEDAGYRKSDLEREPVGVFAGAMWAHYQMIGLNECLAGAGEVPTALHASIANRVSYCFNFRGPSIALDTMCSSSLTALHLACESLRRNECSVALAGGVNVCAHPIKYQLLAQNGMLSTDGRCRSFGARGDGYVPGEGVGVLILKPFASAVRDGDHIYGVIKGSVVNHGGKTNGYTVPNPLAQAEVIQAALRRAAIEPASISYVEAHGTGTALGDPIEMNGLERAFAGTWSDAGSCAVGSIKSNIGHLESAAGVAAISKVLLQFMHEQLAPSLHAEELNPNIDFTRSPFRVVRRLEQWSRTFGPRRAGVSSFGAGGANAHLILEEPPGLPAEPDDATPQLIVLSAKNPERLQAAAARLAAWFEAKSQSHNRPSLADVAWTLQIGREEMDTRVAFLANDYGEARQLALQAARGEQDDTRLKRGERSDLIGTVRALLDGAAGQAFVAQLLDLCDWSKLAELWVAGITVEWKHLHAKPRRRVPLPGYRFSTQRFWAPNILSDAGTATVERSSQVAVTTTTTAPDDLPEDLFLVRDWRPVARLGGVDQESDIRGLLLVNKECSTRLLEEAQRRHWLVVQAGSQMRFDVTGICTMDFNSPAHAQLMILRILSVGPPPSAVIDFVDVWSEPREAWTVELGRIALLQGCLNAPSRGPLQWLHLTNGVHTFAHSSPSMAGAAMSGLVKMLSAECARVRAQTADLERPLATFDEIRAIWAAAQSGPADEVEVCYRGGVRHVPGFRRLQLTQSAELPRVRADRAYLITGGTSGLGLEVARHLVAKGARRLALMGINPLPPRAQWSEKLATADARTRRRLETLIEFERGGVSLETHFGGLDDAQAVQGFLVRVTERLGPIAGVVHSATATFNRPDPYFITKTPEEIQSVLAPKLEGTRQLAVLLERETLDFFVLFSSVASALPSRGQGVSHYAMANSFLDRFAEQQAARGRKQVKCINWVYWGESGGVAGDEHAQKLARYGIFPQTNSEGLASFDRALVMNAPRVLAGRLGDALRTEARLDDAVWRETAAEKETSPPDVAVLEQCSPHHTQARARLDSERASQSELSDYAALALLRAMRSRDVLTAGDRRHGLAELAGQLGVVERQRRLWRALLALLAKKQFIRFTDAESFVTAGRLEADSLKDEFSGLPERAERFARLHPGFAPYIRLIDTAMGSLWEVLRGERSATDILFPRGSLELVEAVYQGNPISDHFNEQLARTAYVWLSANVSARHSSGRRLRVLEVGAGTGGTSARVLEALRPLASHVEYVYTDISSRFIQHGESRFGRDYPFATFRTLDIERGIDAQGFLAGEFDLVLATNVMHATRRLDRSLSEIQRLLRPGGVFLLNELTEVHDFATVTFGLLDGWWQFDDEALRLPDAPLLSELSWRAALEACGFGRVRTWSVPSLTEAEGHYQTLFAVASAARTLELASSARAFIAPAVKVHDMAVIQPVPASLEQEITRVFARELKIPVEELRADVEFGEYGVDSILMGSLVHALEERLNIAINPSLLLEYNTLATLNRRLQQELTTALAAVVPVALVDAGKATMSTRVARPDVSSNGSTNSASSGGKIAVIGLACDFPRAPNLETYWWNLKEGRCAIQEIPADRWRVAELYSPGGGRGKSISKWGGFIENVDRFDPEYFKFRDTDAPIVNPLIRKLLESAVQAVSHAGYQQNELWGQRAGVFVGTRVNEYGLQLHGHHKNRILGSGQNFIAAHLSQFLNLRGPSLVVDSACSSSLVSLHLACQSLLAGDCDVAFAAGVDLLLDERPYLILSEMGALSAEGRCRTFDEKANGFVPGEGCGVVMLKPLTAALADGDAIHAVIDGSAVNNDGHTMGVTTPSPEAQSAVIAEALRRSGVDPRSLGYVETHGTGTLVGDPIELQALTRVLAAGGTHMQFCGVGSVKSNFGHLLSAAGIASFIKVVLGLKAGKIPPTLFCDAPNPRFSFDSSPLYPVRQLTPWSRHGEVRRAGVSSFGLGGTNAHVIVSEAPRSVPVSGTRRQLPPVVFNRRRFWSEAERTVTASRGFETACFEPAPPINSPDVESIAEVDSALELIEDVTAD